MSKTTNNVQTDKLGIELTQEELDQVKPVDWELYLFWQDIQEITLQNYSLKGSSTLTGANFGEGEAIIDRFEERISADYNQEMTEHFEELCEEYGFNRKTTAEMHHYLEDSGERTARILNRLEDDEPLDALTVRKLLTTTKNASRQRFIEYKEQE